MENLNFSLPLCLSQVIMMMNESEEQQTQEQAVFLGRIQVNLDTEHWSYNIYNTRLRNKNRKL